MNDRTLNVLFLCTGNSARSILAEALLDREGHGRFRAFSAGSFPKGSVHPMALDLLARLGFATDGCRSKGWEEFAGPDAPTMDLIITVCDDAAGEVCPVWPGRPVSAHWGIEDPAAAREDRRAEAFERAFGYLRNRISLLLSLPLESLDRISVEHRLQEIGRHRDNG